MLSGCRSSQGKSGSRYRLDESSLTLNTYSHVLPALQADAAAKLDAILRS